MTLNLQYENGKLIVFIVKDKLTNEIYGILDTLNNAQNHIEKLSNLGFSDSNMMIDSYRMIEN